MLKKYKEADFYLLEDVARGRLSPDGISAFFIPSLVFSGILTLVLLNGIKNNINITTPIWPTILKGNFYFFLIHLLITIFFLKEKNYIKFQKLQVVLLNIIIYFISVGFYQVFFLACEDKRAPSYMVRSGMILLLGGFIFLIISTIRAIYRVKQGKFRRGREGMFNFKQSKLYVSSPFVFGLVMLSGTFARSFSGSYDMRKIIPGLMFMLLLCAFVQYGMALAIPEFFLVTYCKFRFKSFNMEPRKRINKKR
ncbi:hypothetical protein SAMN05444401_1471 [Clostridium amylolyticum]|uniref:Uncharacterized protein n=1 Tax=Clostridium amylolyticum TaxID=1121298 RepID=A0A1M6DHK0_9CLOT|nr:hypothetical protein [Clostridium amylolyticum]SHI72573.1 hypothetical protein SAMN05444401_1471 [Clostridium amylolyticum]